MGEADISSKYLVHTAPEAWIQWALRDPTVVIDAQLSGDFQFVARHNDLLFRVHRGAEEFLVLLEMQTRYDAEMPARLLSYTAMARTRYRQPVYPLVVYFLPPGAPTEIPRQYHHEFMGLVTHQDFMVIALWELDAAAVLAQAPPVLLPFVPFMRGMDEETLWQCTQRLQREYPQQQELLAILAMFASKTLGKEVVERIMSIEAEIFSEFPLYQEMIQLAEERGLERGLKRGIEQGVERGLERGIERGMERGMVHGRSIEALSNLSQILIIRLGDIPVAIRTRLAALPVAYLEALIAPAVRAQSYDEFAQHIPPAPPPPPDPALS